MSLFTCPICGNPLTREAGSYRCPNRHSYDISREGYVHLLPANKKHSANPGDDKDMISARTAFLDGGWYAPLKDALCALAVTHTGPAPTVLDAGCGEGYYTDGIFSVLENAGKSPKAAGIDLSKFGLKKAARRAKGVEFAVASVYHLPVADESIDLLVDCFAPLALEEYRRVLKPGGVFLYVVPAAQHLMELKSVLYDNPYPNQEEAIPYDGFDYVDIVPVTAVMELRNKDSLSALFRMTPYAWKTPREGVERLTQLNGLDVTMDFRIHIFKKREE